MRNFLKTYFLFRIDKRDKTNYQLRVLERDHYMYKVLLLVIMILQAIMLFASFASDNFSFSSNGTQTWYRILYAFLFVVCLLAILFIGPLYRKKKIYPYFSIVSITMVAIILWGVGLSILDSLKHTDLTMLTCSIITVALFITLEPWVTSLNIFGSAIVFVTLFILLPDVQPVAGLGFFINLLTIIGISIVGATLNFFRRIHSLELEKKATDLNIQLESKAYVDTLTGVNTRLFLTENINTELNSGDEPSGIILFDIDRFKNINDTYGHPNGDICLAELGNQILRFLEDKNAYCVRYGGEEFLIYFDHITRSQIMRYAEDFRKVIEKHKIKLNNGISISFTVSIGVALAEEHLSYNNLINKADNALYESKITRNKVTFID